MKLSGLYIYPVKSMGGIELPFSQVGRRGLAYDRRYMLVDRKGDFLSQREYPEMALLKTSLEENGITVFRSGGGSESVLLPFSISDAARRSVRIWGDRVEALVAGKLHDAFFSDYLGTECSLVYMPEKANRVVRVGGDMGSDCITSFADDFPFLLTGTASLNDLNHRLEVPVAMDRFRPNFIVETVHPYEEDNWKRIRIGNVEFRIAKPCGRCTIVTLDQNTALRSSEPLRTLSSYRTVKGKVYFGQNVLLGKGDGNTIKVGDNIEVIE